MHISFIAMKADKWHINLFGRIRGLAVIMLKPHPSGTMLLISSSAPLSLDKHWHIMHWMPLCCTAFPVNTSVSGFASWLVKQSWHISQQCCYLWVMHWKQRFQRLGPFCGAGQPGSCPGSQATRGTWCSWNNRTYGASKLRFARAKRIWESSVSWACCHTGSPALF